LDFNVVNVAKLTAERPNPIVSDIATRKSRVSKQPAEIKRKRGAWDFSLRVVAAEPQLRGNRPVHGSVTD
jgi:hypothetical protein